MEKAEHDDRAALASDGDPAKSRVMVVDDEQAIADLVVSLLQQEGIEAMAFTDPAAALAAFKESPFDMAVIDVMMPVMDGFELCTRLRRLSDAPILFLSARDEEADQVIGLTLGADDYVTKPFKPRELVARVRAHLRRSRRGFEGSEVVHRLEVRGLSVDRRAHEAFLHDQKLNLTRKELSILVLLMERAGEAVPAAEIYEGAWGEAFDSGAANTVMVHIRRLRSKLAAVDSSSEYIGTVWGVGYRFLDGPRGVR